MESISLTKKIEKLNAGGHAELASLVSDSAISLTKRGFDVDHVAKVAVCIDISASMTSLFRNGTVKEIVRKALAQGILFDDDGMIDVFTFGGDAYYEGEVGVDEFESFTNELAGKKLEGYTYYCKAVDMIRKHYEDNADGLPAYVIFVTDGSPSNKQSAEDAIRATSKSPIFFQFVGIGANDYDPNEVIRTEVKKAGFMGRMFGAKDETVNHGPNPGRTFQFLAKLDDLEDRPVDNTGFFAVKDPKNIPNERLYDLLMAEYPTWLPVAKEKGIIS